jgi:hypothetical protein
MSADRDDPIVEVPGLRDLKVEHGESLVDISSQLVSGLDDVQRREFHEALLEAATFEDLSGKWQAAILDAEQNRPKLRIISGD